MTKIPQPTHLKKLKTVTCNNLSGQSKITFNIHQSDDDEIYFSISGNTGGGHWSPETIAWTDIQTALQTRPKDAPVTSLYLYPLFKGKSVNTPSFLLAALKSCGLVMPVKGKRRHFELTDPKEFLEEIKSTTSRRASTPLQRKKKLMRKKTSKSTTRKAPKTTKKKTVRK